MTTATADAAYCAARDQYFTAVHSGGDVSAAIAALAAAEAALYAAYADAPAAIPAPLPAAVDGVSREALVCAAALVALSRSEGGEDIYPPHCPEIEAAIAALATGRDPYAPRYWGADWAVWIMDPPPDPERPARERLDGSQWVSEEVYAERQAALAGCRADGVGEATHRAAVAGGGLDPQPGVEVITRTLPIPQWRIVDDDGTAS